MVILSHNVFWFQGTPFGTDRPPGPNVGILERLCAVYREIGPDIICLQEIQNRATFEAAGAGLGMEGTLCEGKDLPQYGGGVFWRAGLGRPLRDSLGAGGATQRMWQVIEVDDDDCCLRICNIHLPSERQVGAERAAVQRMDELREAIGSCDGGPDVVVGDFNEEPGGSTGKYLEGLGYVNAAVCAGRADTPTNLGGGRGDYIWLRRSLSVGLLRFGVADKQDLLSQDRDKEYLSDHLPLWIEVQAQ